MDKQKQSEEMVIYVSEPLFEENKQYKTCNIEFDPWGGAYDGFKFKSIEEARKETAEKFAERLKEKGTIHTEFDWNDYLQIDIDDIDEICKEITEGKK